MSLLEVERIGGIAGFGGPGAHVRSRGQLDFSSLSAKDQQTVESLFKNPGKPAASAMRDGFSYRISRKTGSGTETIEVPESAIPTAIASCVKDELV